MTKLLTLLILLVSCATEGKRLEPMKCESFGDELKRCENHATVCIIEHGNVLSCTEK